MAIVRSGYLIADQSFVSRVSKDEVQFTRTALLEVVAFHHPGSALELEEEAASLLKALS